jgi:hypothetical protein
MITWFFTIRGGCIHMHIFTDYSGTLPEDSKLLGKVLELLKTLGEVCVITGRTKILLPKTLLDNLEIEVLEEYGNPVFNGEIPNLSERELHFFYKIDEQKYIIYPGSTNKIGVLLVLLNKYGESNFKTVLKIKDFRNTIAEKGWRLLRSTQNIGYHNPKHRLYELFTEGKAQSISNKPIRLYIGNEEMDIPCFSLAEKGIWVGNPVGNLPDGTYIVPSPEKLYEYLNTIFTQGSA